MTRTSRTVGPAQTVGEVRIGLMGAPIDAGAGVRGALMGPDALRVAGLPETLRMLGYPVTDHGNAVPRALDAIGHLGLEGNARNAAEIAAWARSLSDHAYGMLVAGEVPIFMGGDHSMAMGTVNGVARYWAEAGREVFVLWLDAHADYNTPDTSPSGNMHGMPMALLCGEPGLDSVFGDEPRGLIDPNHVTMLGIRSIDQQERDRLSARSITVYDMRTIDEFGVAVLIRRVLDRVSARDGVLHVSLDVDYLDPTVAPGVGTTVPGGATYREAHLIMEMLHDSGLVGSLDIAELNPFLDERGRSARVLVELTASLFGQRIIDRPADVRPFQLGVSP